MVSRKVFGGNFAVSAEGSVAVRHTSSLGFPLTNDHFATEFVYVRKVVVTKMMSWKSLCYEFVAK